MAGELKVGVYADVENLARNGGYGLRYDVLREFAARGGSEAVRLNAYVAFDYDRAKDDPQYRANATNFHSALRDFGYRVVQKPMQWFNDESGASVGRANADFDMAVEALLQSERLDQVLLATGSGDFAQVARALQAKGCRVEAVGFNNVSEELKRTVDLYVPGHLIPSLLPSHGGDGRWGEEGSRVRGICYSYSHDRGFGFLRYMDHIAPGLWNIDTRKENSPYASAFAHESEFPAEIDIDDLPSRDYLFEFTLVSSDRGLQAKDLHVVKHG